MYLENHQNNPLNQPCVTFELIPMNNGTADLSHEEDDASTANLDSVIISTDSARNVPVIHPPMNMDSMAPDNLAFDKECMDNDSAGVHFLTDDENNALIIPKLEEPDTYEAVDGVKAKSDLLEYVIRDDGSVICKICGQILASRTHWYRHKYKVHITLNPAPLFKCARCNVFFKSRRGYIGHIHTRHSKKNLPTVEIQPKIVCAEELIEPEAIPKMVAVRKRSDSNNSKTADWEQQREKEEKLVADIIDRVRRECEAQGTTVTRRGYSRRTTVMNS